MPSWALHPKILMVLVTTIGKTSRSSCWGSIAISPHVKPSLSMLVLLNRFLSVLTLQQNRRNVRNLTFTSWRGAHTEGNCSDNLFKPPLFQPPCEVSWNLFQKICLLSLQNPNSRSIFSCASIGLVNTGWLGDSALYSYETSGLFSGIIQSLSWVNCTTRACQLVLGWQNMCIPPSKRNAALTFILVNMNLGYTYLIALRYCLSPPFYLQIVSPYIISALATHLTGDWIRLI